MTFMADHEIRNYADNFMMIRPFSDELISKSVISYGLSSYGYDVRLGTEFARYVPSDVPLDPRNVTNDDVLWDNVKEDDQYVIAPHGFVLARIMESLIMPKSVTGLVKDKSTYARSGIHVQNTVIEAGWIGILTLELNNYLDRPVILRPGQGIAQILFSRSSSVCEYSYAGRTGNKYQNQTGVTLPKVAS